jgi:hypothetical protein
MTKKVVLSVVTIILILCLTTVFGYSGETIKIFMNGKEVSTDVPAMNIGGRVMVPVRFVSEALGAKVDWDAENNKVIITQPNLIKVNGELTTWPYWYEDGNLYMEYKNVIEFLRVNRDPSHYKISYSKSNNLLIINNAIIEVPSQKKGDYTVLSLTYIRDNRGLIKFDWDPETGSITLLPQQ